MAETKQSKQLSPNFKLSEFNQRQAPLPEDKVLVHPDLPARLEKLREYVGKPVVITSGYRTPEYNKRVGGAKQSQHMSGRAADILVPGMTAEQVEPHAKRAGFTYTQRYPNKPHLHVDVRELKKTNQSRIDAVSK